MSLFAVISCGVGAYLLGSIPFGLLAGLKARGIDIREHGSKNIGATNVFRVVGKKWGVAVFLLDALKGFLACQLPLLSGGPGASLAFPLILGVIAIIGHTFPVWLKFKGGKGVATSLGVFLAVVWAPTLISFGIWIVFLAITRIISVSSLVAASFFPFLVYGFTAGSPSRTFLLPVSVALVLFIFFTHRANIKRLRQGTEKKIF